MLEVETGSPEETATMHRDFAQVVSLMPQGPAD